FRSFLHVLFLSSEKEGPKGQGIPAEHKQAVGAVSLRPVPFSIFRILLVGPEVTSREWFLLRHRASYFMGITSVSSGFKQKKSGPSCLRGAAPLDLRLSVGVVGGWVTQEQAAVGDALFHGDAHAEAVRIGCERRLQVSGGVHPVLYRLLSNI